MRVLWITNSILPVVSDLTGVAKSHGGGWRDILSRRFMDDSDIELISVFGTNLHKRIRGEAKNNRWYGFYMPKMTETTVNKKRKVFFEEIIDKEKPDIIHIWGTEFVHDLEMLTAAEASGIRTVVSIQGLISEYAKHYTDYLSQEDIDRCTFHDLLRRDNITGQQKRFYLRGIHEIETIKKAKHVIGRTEWDRSIVESINPLAEYHYCEEILRNEFYDGLRWNYDLCRPHSIFLPESYYPIKGMHIALQILNKLKGKYPDVHLYTTGRDARCRTIGDKIRQNTYGSCIERMIYRYGLEQNITYMGTLNAAQMKDQYLKANVCLQSSVMENSPNSLAEAMITGVPVVASDVGGTRSVLGQYAQYMTYSINEPDTATDMIDEIFSMKNKEMIEGTEERINRKMKQHDPDMICDQYKGCYRSIIDK